MADAPTLENTKPPGVSKAVPPPPPPPPPAKAKQEAAPPKSKSKESKKPNGKESTAPAQSKAAPPTQAKADVKPPEAQPPPPEKPRDKALKAERAWSLADRAAVALAVGGVEEQLLEWWLILEQHILNTDGEKGGTVTFKLEVQPDEEMGLRCRVGSSFSGSSLKRTWKAQIREADDKRQLVLFK